MKKVLVAAFIIVGLSITSCSGREQRKSPSKQASKAVICKEALAFSDQDANRAIAYMLQSLNQSRYFKSQKYRSLMPLWKLKTLKNHTEKMANSISLEKKLIQTLEAKKLARFAKASSRILASLVLRGQITSVSRKNRVLYSLTLQVYHRETGKILWTDEFDIGKSCFSRK